MEVLIKIFKDVKPKESILVSGLPGIAYVGKLSVDYLIRESGADLIGEVYSRFFPSFVLIGKDGVVELLRNEIYHLKNEAGGDLFFFTGNTQASSPQGQYDVAEKVLDKVITFGVRRVYSIAAFLSNRPFETPQVYGSATTTALVQEIVGYGVLPMNHGAISGTNGLIFGLAKKKNIEGICLLGETHGYQTTTGKYLFDVKAVRTVLKVLVEMLNLKIDMDPLDKQTEQMDELILKMAEIERRDIEEMREATDKSSRYIT